jgi:hypothetical protein
MLDNTISTTHRAHITLKCLIVKRRKEESIRFYSPDHYRVRDYNRNVNDKLQSVRAPILEITDRPDPLEKCPIFRYTKLRNCVIYNSSSLLSAGLEMVFQ